MKATIKVTGERKGTVIAICIAALRDKDYIVKYHTDMHTAEVTKEE